MYMDTYTKVAKSPIIHQNLIFTDFGMAVKRTCIQKALVFDINVDTDVQPTELETENCNVNTIRVIGLMPYRLDDDFNFGPHALDALQAFIIIHDFDCHISWEKSWFYCQDTNICMS